MNLFDIELYMNGVLNSSPFAIPMIISGLKRTILSIVILLFVEWINRTKQHALQIDSWHPIARYMCYYALILYILAFGADGQSFIYFQF